MLGGAYGAGVARAKVRPLLDAAVAWLLAQMVNDDTGSSFPPWVGPGIEPAENRSAWCYGNPGIAATLLCAARCVGEPAWEDRAIEIVRIATQRPPEKTGVADAGLCHGAAGLGHVYNRMFQATGEKFLEEAARFWFEQTLELRHHGRGIAGFSTSMPDETGKRAWVDDPGVLTGATGIALALLGAATPIEPAWDRMLLISVPSLDH